MGSIELNWNLLHKAEKQQESLQRRLKEALKAQDPAEYRRRFPEEFQGEQVTDAPAGILLPPELLVPIEHIAWDDLPKKNEGFTIVNALIWVTVILVLIPIAMIWILLGTIVPGIFVLFIALYLVYLAGRLRERIRSP